MGTDVKICGITNRGDAEVAAAAGARYIGAVMYAPSPRDVTPEAARDFAAGLSLELVIVVVDEVPDEVERRARTASAAVVQLHGAETPAVARRIRNAGPWKVWKAVRARDAATVLEAVDRFGDAVDGLLVDGWHPRRIGGTGVRVRWETLPRLRERWSGGVLVAAGGLTPENVGDVLTAARPHVVDVSSGVERSPGRKDAGRIRAFVEAVRAADQRVQKNGRSGR